MAQLQPRDLAAEVSKHFAGTPQERIHVALRLGTQAVDLFLATLPAGTPWAVAADTLRRNKHRGRRPSAVMDAPRA